MAGMGIGGMIGLWLDPADPPDPPPLGDLGQNSYVRNCPVPLVFGQCKVYGGVIWIGENIVSMDNTGSSKQPSYTAMYYAQFAVALSEGEISGVVTHQVNDKSIAELEEDDAINLTFWVFNGTGDQLTPPIFTYDLGDDALPFRYTAYVAAVGQIGTSNNLPTYSAIMDGMCIETNIDANPIVVLYQFLINTRWGLGISTEWIDGHYSVPGNSWSTAKDYCDVLVDDGAGGTHPRFGYANAFTDRQKAYDIIQDILLTCRGFMYYSEGKLKVKIGNPDEEPVFHFADENTLEFTINNTSTVNRIYADFSAYPINYFMGDLGNITISSLAYKFIVIAQTATYIDLADNLDYVPSNGTTFNLTKDNMTKESFSYNHLPLAETNNRINLQFINRADVVDPKDIYRQDFIEEDNVYDINETGEIREKQITMNGIKRKAQAARMAAFYCDSSAMVKYTCEFQTDVLGFLLTIGDIVGITHKVPGWTAKEFRIIEMEELEDYNVKVSCVEYIPDIYHDYYSPITLTTGNNLDFYDKPDHVERFLVYEDPLTQSIIITYKRPDNNPYWGKAAIYIQKGAGTWEYFKTMYNCTPSVELDGAIDSSVTTITYDPLTMYSSFAAIGSFFIDQEEIYYSGIDDITNQFTGCVRGYNNTTEASHLDNTYCVSRNKLDYSEISYPYTIDDIGITLNFKALSISAFNIYALATGAPTTSIIPLGLYSKPPSPSSLEINGQGNDVTLVASDDAVITWRTVTEGIYKGYGFIYGSGAGYGGGVAEGVDYHIIRIYKTLDSTLLQEIIVEDVAEPTYTYTSAMNIADNGSYEENLTFEVYQVNSISVESMPSILITNV
jgi:hypothetical protein